MALDEARITALREFGGVTQAKERYRAVRGLRGLLYNVSALDPPTLAAASLFLLLVALAASAIPARRATRIDPIQVFRAE